MRSHTVFIALLCHALFSHVLAAGTIRSIFLFKDVLKSNTTALQTSGFNTLIIFGVGVLPNGDIMYYSNTPGSKDVLVASGGSYVGGDALATKVRTFKTGINTTVTRLEISMNAQNIRALMASPGPGATTPLYRNFAALKTAWTLDAVNNDDESVYDTASTVSFARMLGAIGYRYTIAPYTVPSFWAGVVAGANRDLKDLLLDKVYLQCYDGGAGNVPATWRASLGMAVVPVLWVINDSKPVYGQSPAQAREQFAQWSREGGGMAGGGYWNDYDIEKMGSSYEEYGYVLQDVFR
ncbi:hypothetical protein C8A01DRAFT_48541 [Parachaetomium inaequale]|uniref:Coagulation factor 5/8 type domain-containing protein n=1 Tax=Parachaetomium inaequale TaxID=2588326 RepID=A0AAN6PF09_9PEZI|nr:hypothetical protein C8A01DRAFT_48541 [Parachaetomium inaequale]